MPRTLALAAALALFAPLPSLAEVPRVVTDIPPVHALVMQVLGDLGTAEVLLPSGGNAHNYQLRPSQARALAEADLVVWIGPEMTPWLDRALDGIGGAARSLVLIDAEGTYRRDFGDPAEAHAHDEGHDPAEDHAGHADEHEEGHDGHEAGHDEGHDHSGLDPHAWLDPANARAWLDLIAADLAAADPANAATYAANALAAADGIAALDADLAQRLSVVGDRPFVVFHDAYGYFAAHYGLAVAGSVALGDATAPGAARLAALRDRLAGGGIVCAFPEAQHDPALVQAVADGTGVRIGGPLDPAGANLPPGAGLYAALLTGIADTLIACLSGG